MTDKILPENCPKAVCSVTDLAKLLSCNEPSINVTDGFICRLLTGW